MVSNGQSANAEALLSRLDVSPELIRSLRLGKTYEARLRAALLDPNERAFLSDGLNPVLTSSELGEMELLSAAAAIKGGLMEIARWKAVHPGSSLGEGTRQ